MDSGKELCVKYLIIISYAILKEKAHHMLDTQGYRTKEHSHCSSTAAVVVVIISVSLPNVLTPLQHNDMSDHATSDNCNLHRVKLNLY